MMGRFFLLILGAVFIAACQNDAKDKNDKMSCSFFSGLKGRVQIKLDLEKDIEQLIDIPVTISIKDVLQQ